MTSIVIVDISTIVASYQSKFFMIFQALLKFVSTSFHWMGIYFEKIRVLEVFSDRFYHQAGKKSTF